ncbi:MAG: hypothetical protein KatS3mg057_0493 [Herpetosiphonaceae bacterium]|nr:MAG: hypothetical protein KatS3mg057_0493 [Herpetosiphonaceae bacterium]
MPFPPYVHSVVPESDEGRWLVQAQGENECGCTTPANALNLLFPDRRISKDQLIREAGIFFQRRLGGSPSPITGWLLKRHGAGTHFGNLSRTDKEKVLRDLIDRRVPVIIELWENRVGPLTIYGQHSVLLLGYSEPFTDAAGVRREEYYILDAAYAPGGRFGLETNNVDRDGDGVPEPFPGNRTFQRSDFLAAFSTGIYFPVFPSQLEHDAWYHQHLRTLPALPVVGWLRDQLLTGSYDEWVG